MPGMGKVAALLRAAMPDKWPYVNLFPYRVTAGRLGTATMTTYVRMLVKTIGQPFLSYDNYSLVNGEMLDYFYTNLEIVRRLGLETKTPFWNCILANAHFNYMEPSDATFHLQVYSTLAYGGRGIQYFTYFTPTVGNYRLGAIDQFGNRTADVGDAAADQQPDSRARANVDQAAQHGRVPLSGCARAGRSGSGRAG